MKHKKRFVMLFTLVLAMGFLFQSTDVSAASAMKLSKKKLTLSVGQQKTLKVKNTTKTVKWSTSKKSVAKVDKKGVVTAKKQGTATITAAVGKKKLTCKVTVKERPTLQEKEYICVGKKTKLTVTGTAKKVTWSSSNKNIVKVNKKGVITGVKKGKATITAKVGNKKLTCKVSVKDAVTKVSQPLKVDNVGVVGVTFLSDSISCESSNPEIATVTFYDEGCSEEGYGRDAMIIVYGHKSGTATITITNNCNNKKVKFKVEVDKPKVDTGYQRLLDYILLKGSLNEEGYYYIAKKSEDGKAAATILFDYWEEEILYEYKETSDVATVDWTVLSMDNHGKDTTLTMWIQRADTEESTFVTGKINLSTYNGEDIVFEKGWYRTPVDDELQEIANTATRNAVQNIEALIQEETGMTWEDVR